MGLLLLTNRSSSYLIASFLKKSRIVDPPKAKYPTSSPLQASVKKKNSSGSERDVLLQFGAFFCGEDNRSDHGGSNCNVPLTDEFNSKRRNCINFTYKTSPNSGLVMTVLILLFSV